MSKEISPWGILPEGWKVSTIDAEKTQLFDYVANGSFASLAENVQYKQEEDFAVLIRLVDYNNDFKDNFVYITEHAYNFLGKSKLFGGEIIISNVGANVGTVFKAPYLKKPMSLAPNAICVKLKGNNDFYYYWFKSRIGQYLLNSLVSGSAQPKFNKTHFKSMPIPVPPIHEQDRIASILSSLDDKIAVNKKICENLEAQAQALFKHWFVDFAPFKDGKFVESELGLIPEGWRVGTLMDLGDVVGGATPSKSNPAYFTDKGIAWLTPKDLSNSNYKFTSRGEIDITEEGYKSTSTKLMPKGSVLFSSRAPIGYITIAKNEICTNQGFKSVVPKVAGTAYLYYFLKTNTAKIESMSSGTTFKEASGALMKSLPAVVPPQIQLDAFENTVKEIFSLQESLETENQRLATLRDTLLPKLMSGQIKL